MVATPMKPEVEPTVAGLRRVRMSPPRRVFAWTSSAPMIFIQVPPTVPVAPSKECVTIWFSHSFVGCENHYHMPSRTRSRPTRVTSDRPNTRRGFTPDLRHAPGADVRDDSPPRAAPNGGKGGSLAGRRRHSAAHPAGPSPGAGGGTGPWLMPPARS